MTAFERDVSDRAELRLVGPGGEPVDLARTLASHGFADLTPHRLDEEARTLETTFALGRGARTSTGSANRTRSRSSRSSAATECASGSARAAS